MNSQQEFINEIFHVLAQPITALRAAVELGLHKELSGPAAREVLADSLQLIDCLMGDLSLLRELANLDEPPPLDSHEAASLLEECISEISPVAETSDIELHLSLETAQIECNAKFLHRAMFVLLDEMIAGSPSGGRISLTLRGSSDGARLELFPGLSQEPRPSLRRKLCGKLLQFAGGSAIGFASCGTSVTFRKSDGRQVPANSLAHKRLLTVH